MNELSRMLRFEIEKVQARDEEIARLRMVNYHLVKYPALYGVAGFVLGAIAASIVII